MDVDVMNVTMRELLERRAEELADKTYLFYEDQRISYGEFNARVNRVANRLKEWGVEKGEMVGMFIKNCPEFLYIYFALAKLGAIMVPMNTGYPPAELEYAVNHSGQRLLLASSDLQPVVEEARPRCRELKEVIFIGPEPVPGHRTFAEWIEGASEDLDPTHVTADDIVANIYTSGTTGRPKGVLLRQRSYPLAGEFWCGAMECTPEDRCMGFFPLFHANVGVYVVMGTILYKAAFILLERFSVKNHWDLCRHYGATEFNSVGSVTQMLYAAPPRPDDGDNPVRVVISGINVGSIKEGFERRFGVTVLDPYGLTELLPGTIERMGDLPTRTPKRLYTIGRPGDRTELRIMDDEGRELPPGEVGEICLRGPAVTAGYFKDPRATAEAMRDGWFHTGDNGYLDEEGFVYFVDRKKDMIKRRGENIASGEVERVLNAHPLIQESAVIGVPDPFADEEVKAYVILRPGAELPPEEIIEWCRDHLADFKVPRYIEFRESFPRPAAIPKVLKTELRREKEDLTSGCYDRGPKLPPRRQET